MELTDRQRGAVSRAAGEADVDFVRVFGSSVTDPDRARDIDLAVGVRPLTLEELATFQQSLEGEFHKPVDVVCLRSGLPPLLVREIATGSEVLYETSGGRERYADLIDRLMAVALDEILGYPRELREEALRNVERKLRVS